LGSVAVLDFKLDKLCLKIEEVASCEVLKLSDDSILLVSNKLS
jgi:hypothetical protein